MHPSPHSTTRAARLATLAAAALVLAAPAPESRGDAVRIGDLWYNRVTVVEITATQVRYVTEAGQDVAKALPELTGLKLDAYAEMTRAEDLIAADRRPEEALRLLKQVRARAQKPWVRQWVDYRRVMLADKTGQALEAIEAYATLALERAPKALLAAPPGASARGLKSSQDRAQALKLVQDALARVKDGPGAEGLGSLRELLAGEAGAEPGPDGAAPQPGAGTAALSSVIPLPREFPANDPLTRQLARGEFAKLLAQVDRTIDAEPQNGALRFYQKGLAQLHTALATPAQPDVEGLKSAGLSFMRVVIHYPKSRWAGYAMLEAGLVHQKVGRADLAQALYERAAAAIDADDAAMQERCQQLTRSLAAPGK